MERVKQYEKKTKHMGRNEVKHNFTSSHSFYPISHYTID